MGRPKGSKNSSKEVVIMADKLAAVIVDQDAAAEKATAAFASDPNFHETVKTQEIVNAMVSTPPADIVRNDHGLLQNLHYVFDKLGFVDWRRLIPVEYLVLNSDQKDRIEKKYGKKMEEIDIEKDKIEDSDLIILLGGIKYLARIRGIEAVTFEICESTPEFASVRCEVAFIPNYETKLGQPKEFQDNASASQSNTKNFAKLYPLEIATNRAFSRAIRNGLGINIVSKEELGAGFVVEDKSDSLPPTHLAVVLDNFLKEKSVTFTVLQEKLIAKVNAEGARVYPEAEKWEKSADIPQNQIFAILSQLKKNGDKLPPN
jgi:hypothetical protein